jgi:hypothetical protein
MRPRPACGPCLTRPHPSWRTRPRSPATVSGPMVWPRGPPRRNRREGSSPLPHTLGREDRAFREALRRLWWRMPDKRPKRR